MLKKFASWFIVFGLSFLVSDVFGWTEQGKAFLYIHMGVAVLVFLVLVTILVAGGLVTRRASEANGISFLLVLMTALSLAITLFATWGATKLFGVNFYVAYQIMTFGQCLCVEGRNKDN